MKKTPAFFSLAAPSLVAIALAAAASGCPDPETIVEEKSAIEHGKALTADPKLGGSTFNELTCSLCHAEHDGDSAATLSGAPLAGALDRPSFWGGQVATPLEAINACLYYFMLSDRDLVPGDVEAGALYAYLGSLPASDDEKAAQPFTIAAQIEPPFVDDGRGKAVYTAACASCHGSKTSGEGRLVKRAPILPDETLAAHPIGDYTEAERRGVFVEKTRHGGFLGYGGQMPPFSAETLSDEDVSAMLAYLGVP